MADRTERSTSYALERLFANQRQRQRLAQGISTNKWKRYRCGTTPATALVETVEERLPGTRLWLELPLWELLEMPGPSPQRIAALVSSLPSDLLNLFIEADRLRDYTQLLDCLDGRCEIESLTASLAILRCTDPCLRIERRSFAIHERAGFVALGILRNLAAIHTSFRVIFRPLFEYFDRELIRVPCDLSPSGFVSDIAISTKREIGVLLEQPGVVAPTAVSWRKFIYAMDHLYDGNIHALWNLSGLLCAHSRLNCLPDCKRDMKVLRVIVAMGDAPEFDSPLDANFVSPSRRLWPVFGAHALQIATM